jgi:hypothetical protein
MWLNTSEYYYLINRQTSTFVLSLINMNNNPAARNILIFFHLEGRFMPIKLVQPRHFLFM